jgi:hypothetical protein
MSANDSTQLVVAGNGAIFVAPLETPLPTDVTGSLDTAFVELGYATEEGVTLTCTPDIKDFGAWQSLQAIRRIRNAQEIEAAFELQQWNSDTVQFAFGGGEITEPSTGVFRYEFPEAGDALDERAMVIDAQDGDRNIRFVFPRGNVTEAVSSKFQATDRAILPIGFKMLKPTDGSPTAAVLFDDDLAFSAAS